MLPIIEVIEQRKNRWNPKVRTYIICRSPEHGAILRRQMVGNTLTKKEIADRVLIFKKDMDEWFIPQMVKSKCDNYLL